MCEPSVCILLIRFLDSYIAIVKWTYLNDRFILWSHSGSQIVCDARVPARHYQNKEQYSHAAHVTADLNLAMIFIFP